MRGYILTITFSVLFALSGFAQEKYTLSGYLKDKSNGESFIGATVYVEELKSGTSTNMSGFYSITIPKGTYNITFSYIGYGSITKTIELKENVKINLELEEESTSLDAVEIMGERQDKNVTSVEMSTVNLKMETLKKLPAFMGEVDVIKSIQMLPGIQKGGEGNTGFFVRGGSSDQNLILLDDAPVYNASHFLGFFSVFNADAIKDVQIYKGGIPAKWGGRLSSLLDIRMKEGNSKKFSGSGGIGTVASRLTLEGPIKKDKSSFIISGRRTYFDVFRHLSNNDGVKKSRVYFYDFNAKINYTLNQNNRLFLSSYFGRDVFRFSDLYQMSYGNGTGTIRWNHLFNEKFFANIMGSYSNYDYNLGILGGGQSANWASNIEDISGKSEFTYYLNPDNTLEFGANVIRHNMDPGLITGESLPRDIKMPDNHAWESAAYVSNEQKINGIVTLQYGLRFSHFANVGPGTIFTYDKSDPTRYFVADSSKYSKGTIFNTYHNFEPRFAVNVTLNEKSSVKANYNRTTQYLHLANNSSSASPLAIWFPSTPNVKPQLADQVAVGYFRNFKQNTFEGSAEIYYKKMQNAIDFKDHAFLFLNEYLDGELRIGDARSMGFEFMIRKQTGKLNGWISYTLSRTTRTIPEINNGKEFLAPYDRRHDISFVSSYQLSQNKSFGLSWVYSTGAPITIPIGKYTYLGNTVPIYNDRNSERMPAFHRMDISFTIDEKKHKLYEGSWNFSIYNVYYRKNAYTINFQASEENPAITEAYKIYFFAIIPAVTYNFKF